MHIEADKDISTVKNRDGNLSFEPCSALFRCGLRPTFFFEGAIRLTERETLSFAERVNYDWIKKGRFFKFPKLEELGEIYFHKLHPSYLVNGKYKGVASEIALGENVRHGKREFIYVNHPLKYKGFEFYRDQDGYSPLFVLRDKRRRVIYGAYAPHQSIRQEDGTFLYTSGTAVKPGSFPFPKDPDRPEIPTLFSLQTTYYPGKEKKTAGEVLFQGWHFEPGPWSEPEEGKELFKRKAALEERIRAGDYFLSMDEVRYWSRMKVLYRPGFGIIFFSFWSGLGGLILSAIPKMAGSGRSR